MSYIHTYWLDCEAPADYNNGGCLDVEFARVRSVAFIRRRYLATLLLDAANPEVWQAGMNAGNIVILPFVAGSFDPGEPAALKGYGRRLTTRGPRDMVLTFTDPAYVLNYAFYNRLQQHTDFVLAFRSHSVLHIGEALTDMFARNVISEDLQETIAWEVKATWRSVDLPILLEVAPLASLFNAIPAQSTTIYFASGYYVSLKARLIDRFEVGAIGSPMNEGDTVYMNPLLAGRKVLVIASGLGLPVDDGVGSVDWTNSLIRHVKKADASTEITFVGGVAPHEIIEIYELT